MYFGRFKSLKAHTNRGNWRSLFRSSITHFPSIIRDKKNYFVYHVHRYTCAPSRLKTPKNSLKRDPKRIPLFSLRCFVGFCMVSELWKSWDFRSLFGIDMSRICSKFWEKGTDLSVLPTTKRGLPRYTCDSAVHIKIVKRMSRRTEI